MGQILFNDQIDIKQFFYTLRDNNLLHRLNKTFGCEPSKKDQKKCYGILKS